MSLAILSKKNNVLRTSNSINIVNTNKVNTGMMFGSFTKRYYHCRDNKTVSLSTKVPSVGDIIHKQYIKCSGKVVTPNKAYENHSTIGCVDNNIVKITDVATITEYLNEIYKAECLDKTYEKEVIQENSYNVIYGTEGDDVLYGTDGDDIIYGMGGDDIIYGMGGDDIIYGGYGDDVLYGGYGDDVLYGGYGDDVLYGGYGDDIIYNN